SQWCGSRDVHGNDAGRQPRRERIPCPGGHYRRDARYRAETHRFEAACRRHANPGRALIAHDSPGTYDGHTLGLFWGALSSVVLGRIYGVMAFQVARRQKEIGIRLALGARPAQVTRMVLGETALPVGAGVAGGIAGALVLTRVLEKMLFGVKPTDPVTFVVACGLLFALALMAAYLPGRLAAPGIRIETLRCE